MFPPQFIIASRIGTALEIGSKKRLLEVLAELLATDDTALQAEAVFERLLERERLGSTGLGHGIALPHARVKEVRDAIGAFVQLQRGVDFDAIDDQPVDLAFALLVPESATEMHLKLLSRLANMFSDPQLRERLRRADSAEEILGLMEDWEERPRES
ncbi:MAG: PTS IIA-like nitrogen regulatory protein PtsN [Chromatiaceae bacterium]|jgi:PTS system nitrogen regulatory IIA component